MEDYGLPTDGGASFWEALLGYVTLPSDYTWDLLAHRIIPKSRGRTVWQAWMAVDNTAPRALRSLTAEEAEEAGSTSDWQGRWPDAATLRIAITQATGGEIDVMDAVTTRLGKEQ